MFADTDGVGEANGDGAGFVVGAGLAEVVEDLCVEAGHCSADLTSSVVRLLATITSPLTAPLALGEAVFLASDAALDSPA